MYWEECELKRLALIALAGAIGTLARYGVSGLVQEWSGARFPWGTLAVNVLGCLLFGVVVSAAEERQLIGSETRFIVLTGFMGAFTTFSTFAFETSAYLRESEWSYATINLVGQNLLGLIGVLVGLILGRLL